MLKIIIVLLLLACNHYSYSIHLSPSNYYYGRSAEEFSKCFAPSYGEQVQLSYGCSFSELIFQTKYDIGYTDCVEMCLSEEACTHFDWQSWYDQNIGDDFGYCNLRTSQQASPAPLFYNPAWNEFLWQSCGFISSRAKRQIHFKCTSAIMSPLNWRKCLCTLQYTFINKAAIIKFFNIFNVIFFIYILFILWYLVVLKPA